MESRRRNVLVKLSAAAQTDVDFKELAAVFGLDVEVTPGADSLGFPLTFPVLFIGTASEARFTIIITVSNIIGAGFPFTFPLTFAEPTLDIMKCFFNKLKPANTQIIFIQG